MNNKKILIWLGMILSILIVFLIVYIINSNNSAVKLSPTPPATIQKKQQSTIKAKEQHLAELEKLKREMKGITNETFTIETSPENVEDCSGDCSIEELIQYEKQIVNGVAQVAEGRIVEILNSSLKVKFQQASISWISIVNLDQKSSISTFNLKLESSPISLMDLKIGDRVVIKTKRTNITDKSFVAESVMRME